jgi:hypothetical protein
MKGSFWNSDGFKDTAKHNFVRETIRDFKLDFFAILETGRGNFSTLFLNNISNGQDFQWYCVPPIGRSGGDFSRHKCKFFICLTGGHRG